QDALDEVEPGDTIRLAPGVYEESCQTKKDGLPDKPITIQGPSLSKRGEAIIKGDDTTNRVVQIFHDYYKMKDCTIDGKVGDNEYRDKLLYVQGKREPRDLTIDGRSFRSSIDGLVVEGMTLRNAGGECLRLRNFVTNSNIYNNLITDCGVEDYVLNPDLGNKNGEGCYIGTTPSKWEDNTVSEPDGCNWNWVHDNKFNTMGNEAIDIKEGSMYNILEHNTCLGQLDEDSGAGINIRGDYNIIRFNNIQENKGAGVRLGGAELDENDDQFGRNNRVYKNILYKNENSGVKIMAPNQQFICENTITPTEPEEE
ncbi:unnamed protein product, partial [Discosporangium mesarthrocarpum]